MSDPIRWGIIGLGAIAKQFARGLGALPDAKLVAVGSRSLEKAKAFAAEFHVPHTHDSYQGVVQDGDVDVVYIATPHPMHHGNALLCLEGGKAVLCEKPFTVNAAELEELIAVARRRQVFLMEAMWTRFLPAIQRVQTWIASGAIGEARMLSADFGFRCTWDPNNRLLAPELAGGALLDVGVYPIALASMLFGRPSRVTGLAHLGETGVDEQSAYVISYSQGQLAVLSSAVRTSTTHEARIDGSDGRITIPNFWHATKATLQAPHQHETIELQLVGNGYHYQAQEVGRCLRAGRLESTLMSLDESLSIMRTMDELRQQWGLRYPSERERERERESEALPGSKTERLARVSKRKR